MKFRVASVLGAFALLWGEGISLAQPNPCAPYKLETGIGAADQCYFDAYVPWLPVGSGFNAEINLRNPKTADTLGAHVSFTIVSFYPKGGSTAAGFTNVLMSIDGQAPIFSGGLDVSLNPGEKRDIVIFDECFQDDLAHCNNALQVDKNPSVSVWLRVHGPNPKVLSAQGLLQFQDFVPGGTILTMDKFRRDSDLSWEWQTPLIQTPVGDPTTPQRFNAVAVLNASDQSAIVQFDVVDEIGRTFRSMTTSQLPPTNLCPSTLPPWGSCGFLVVGRAGFKDGQGNAVDDPIGLFPSTTVLPKLYSDDGMFRGTLKVTNPSGGMLVVSGYTWRGPGAMGTLVFEPIPH